MSFFRGARSSNLSRTRDSVIKESLTNNLSECVKAIQFNQQIEDCHHQVIESNDVSNSLCCALEAIFLHGLKDSIFKKAKSAFTGDIDQKPEPSFWSLILLLSHSDSIKHISTLQQISTEIGQCRAWLRMALNDCLLSSYITTVLRNMNSTKSFYSTSAYIRDAEMLDVAQRLLEGIESCTQFNLPINSSLLNAWPEDVLMLIGIWTPTMRSCPIAPGVDVASTLKSNEPEINKRPFIPNRDSNILGLGQMLAMDQDEAFNYIIACTSDDIIEDISRTIQTETQNLPGTSSSQLDSKLEEILDKPLLEKEDSSPNDTENKDDSDSIIEIEERFARADLSNIGNSLTGKTAWSTDFNDGLNLSTTSNSSETGSLVKTPDSKSLSSLVDLGPFVKTSNLREVTKELHKELKLIGNDGENEPTNILDSLQTSMDDPMLAGLGFEVVSKIPSAEFELPELKTMISHLGTLSREYGLDSQDYQCIYCHDMLGTTISKAKVCAYTGEYFCSNCMDPNVFMIPARVIHNWDFRRYPVSKRSGLFLLEFQHQPLLNMKKINPLIYMGVDEMATLQLLRIQLNFLRAYLFTCREPVIEELQKRVWPREYLYEQIHLYSVSDLAQIPNGSLANQLQKVVSFARGHVHDCWLCSQKGFICEVCKVPKVLYPFDIETTFRCEVCSSVFHSKCLNATKPCPKCDRKKKRQAISLVDAVHSNIG